MTVLSQPGLARVRRGKGPRTRRQLRLHRLRLHQAEMDARRDRLRKGARG